jgi:hypothetical protein
MENGAGALAEGDGSLGSFGSLNQIAILVQWDY